MEKRFFVEGSDKIDVGSKIILTEDEHTHLSRIMRLRVGDEVECFQDGSDVFVCKILMETKTATTLEVLDSYPCLANPKVDITLFQALPKLDKLELITQKLCEIGVSRIVPFYSKFCIAKPNEQKVERLKKIVVSACKQCGRTSLLQIDLPKKIAEILPMLKNFDFVLFANEKEDAKNIGSALLDMGKEIKGKKRPSIAYVVGSEGGFSPEEIDTLSKVCTSVSFGKRILRTETASIFVASLLCGMLEV